MAVSGSEQSYVDIEKFVPKVSLDDRYRDTPYYLAPEDRVGQEAFAVIRRTVFSPPLPPATDVLLRSSKVIWGADPTEINVQSDIPAPARYEFGLKEAVQPGASILMKRILGACIAVAFGANIVTAANPAVDAAIKKVQAVVADTAKMRLFCDLDDALEAAEDKDDPALEKRIDQLVAQLGPDFAAAWKVGDELEEGSADHKEFSAAIDALGEKCP